MLGSDSTALQPHGYKPKYSIIIGEPSTDVSCDHLSAELHAVNSVPILPTRAQACSGIYNQRLSHIPPGKVFAIKNTVRIL